VARLSVSRVLFQILRSFADHLSRSTVASRLARILWWASGGNLFWDISPCSRQGLPSSHVTMRCCALLPHSFHLFPSCER